MIEPFVYTHRGMYFTRLVFFAITKAMLARRTIVAAKRAAFTHMYLVASDFLTSMAHVEGTPGTEDWAWFTPIQMRNVFWI